MMRLVTKDADRCVGCEICMFACARRQGEGGLARACLGVRSVGGMERGFIVVVCRACPDPPCVKVCRTKALVVKEGGGGCILTQTNASAVAIVAMLA